MPFLLPPPEDRLRLEEDAGGWVATARAAVRSDGAGIGVAPSGEDTPAPSWGVGPPKPQKMQRGCSPSGTWFVS